MNTTADKGKPVYGFEEFMVDSIEISLRSELALGTPDLLYRLKEMKRRVSESYAAQLNDFLASAPTHTEGP